MTTKPPCTIDGCEKEQRARGWCVTHYWRWSQHGDPTRTVRVKGSPTCEAPGCNTATPKNAKHCEMHRARLARSGSFDLLARDRYRQPSGYWHVKRPGHPLASEKGWVREHRVVLYETIGPGEHPCHWCGVQVSFSKPYPQHLDGLVVDHLDEDTSNNDPANLVPSCAVCNLGRSSRWKKRREETV